MKRILCITTLMLFAAMVNAQTSSQYPSSSGQSMPSAGQSSSMGQSSTGQASSSTAEEQQLIGIEHQWADAAKRGDATTVGRIESDSYVFTDPSGKTTGKQDDVNMIKTGQAKYQTFDLSDMQAHVFSGNTAVVTGRVKLQGTENGKDVSGTYAFTDTYVKNNGQWQVVASQVTPISGTAGQSTSQPAAPPPQQ